LSEEQDQELAEWIEEAGGEIVFTDYTGFVDYLVTPITGEVVFTDGSAEWIAEAGGEIVFSDYTGIVDCLVTPITGEKKKGEVVFTDGSAEWIA
jgi:hypothetical protein